MSREPLCIRTFAELIRGRMSKKAQIKSFDADRKMFQSDVEAKRRNEEINLSQVNAFYKLLLDAVIYKAFSNGETGIPDISSTMTSQLKTGKQEIHNEIKIIAQRKDAKEIVSLYFEVNLIPNIPGSVRSSVLDDIDTLIRNSSDVSGRKRNSLKAAYLQRKSDAAYLAEVYLLAICNGTNKINVTSPQPEITAKKQKSKDSIEKQLDALEALIAALPAPKEIKPPQQPQEEELPYIRELYAAYGDKEGIKDFCETHLAQYDEYNEDMDDRRIDYFAAESIRQGVRELYSADCENQFGNLKADILAGVINTARMSFPNGYDKMLSVMTQASNTQASLYVLSRSPNWISNRIKMGVCHFLVTDNKLRWVKK